MAKNGMIVRMISNCAKIASLAIGAFGLAACVTTAPVPELIEAATPKPETPSIVSGPLRDACVGEPKFLFSKPAIDPEGIYKPTVTYKLAARMHISKTMAPYASRLRAYAVGVHGKNIIGQLSTRQVICVYELQAGNLKYLSSIWLTTDGRANRQFIDSALVEGYRKMSGKDSLAERLFGISYP